MHTSQLRPYITTCQCHAARSPFRADGLDLRICSYLDEALNEVFRQRRAFGIFFRSEVLEYVCELLPEVQGFLLHFHIVSMFLPITSLCVLSCPVQYISQLPCFSSSLLLSSLLFSCPLFSSLLFSSLLFSSSLFSLPNRLYPSTFSFSFSFPLFLLLPKKNSEKSHSPETPDDY